LRKIRRDASSQGASPRTGTSVCILCCLTSRFIWFGLIFGVMVYSLQESQGRYSVNVDPDLVKSKGWEKGQGLDLNLVKNKIKVVEGDQVTLQHSNRGYHISLPLAENLDWGKGTELEWKVDGNGDLVLQTH
jgi:hypothetical protein